MKRSTLLIAMLAMALTLPQPLAAQQRAPQNAVAEKKTPEVYPETKAQPEQTLRASVQITELGLMRTLLILTEEAKDLQKLISQRLVDVDFRVFPSVKVVPATLSSADMRRVGDENKADLVLVADVQTRVKNKMGEFQVCEGEATIQIFSPVSGELLVAQTNRVSGVRHVDPREANRSAREGALDMASREAIPKALEKAHKMIVHIAKIKGVRDNQQLLVIKEHLAKMEGVYHVRQITFDAGTQTAELEIIGAPRGEEFWRAWLEKMPRTQITVTMAPRASKPSGIPAWFPKR